jgi:mono/diheme cytochrome c family protein
MARPLAIALLIFASALGRLAAAQPATGKTDFNRDIRPVLSNHCAKCHGPDAKERKGGTDGLRLDVRDDALADLGGYAAIVPGKPEKSALIQRITSANDDERMPPKASGKQLTPREIELLVRWIKEGANYAQHWSYARAVRPPLPTVKQTDWPRNEIDYFLLQRLEQENLQPSSEAERSALLRRVSLDLTGLPPTSADLEEFGGTSSTRQDGAKDWYEAYVDKILDSPRYGEHWAHDWLDLARYADSAGYADDPPRTIWPFRDYVIRSLNANKPLDQFTIEQIAGDLLPNPTEEQLIATAFHRNTLTNSEGGTIDEEFRNAAIVDRVNTTLAVWMGTTMACAQCHSHKYDPITQQEYFRVFAFFNNTEDADRKEETPILSMYSPQQLQQKATWQKEIQTLTKSLGTETPELLAGQAKWEAEFPDDDLELALTPDPILKILSIPAAERTEAQQSEVKKHYLLVAPARRESRRRAAQLNKQLADQKPASTVPIMKELPHGKQRTTKLQYRGNYLELGEEVAPGTPACFPPPPEGIPTNRLALARWLIDESNPLTARVFANRFWEAIFGIGIVATSEDFGSQGDLPSHPELLDWLATELIRLQWNQKAFLKMIVTSAAYRQSSRVTPELLARDPDNRLLARGPRVRLSAEMVRDQALAVSGLLSAKMFGPPVKPPQPTLGLNAAFGGAVDWQASTGDDKYRRALYTTWRRSSPYPSMATFDAPNREVCTLRRVRTNTPLQALVTLNDPVYVEAAQAFARKIAASGGASTTEKVAFAFQVGLARPPQPAEAVRLAKLFDQSLAEFQRDAEAAKKMATEPLGAAPDGVNLAELAAWTVVSNVLLNLDEMFMKR